jgi:hypothetical protein
MSSKKTVPDISKLFQTAQQEGLLSPASLQALTVVDIGAEIQAGLGVTVDQVTASEMVLVTMMPDDSGSIRFAGNSQAVRDGHNLVLDALAASKQKNNVLAYTRYLNGQVLFPYSPLDQAIRMTSSNYDPNQGTPLYDQAVILLGTVLAKTQEFADNGVPVRTVTLLISDGDDQHSCRSTAQQVASLVHDLRRAENHIVAAMGVSNGHVDFHTVFRSMGIPDEWILTPGNSAGEIRRAFQVFSQSAVRVTAGTQSFSQSLLGGFSVN